MTETHTRTQPSGEPAPPSPRSGPLGAPVAFLRNAWRQLTSMRTALILLFLLALASLPGALLPQWSLNSAKTAQYIADHPTIGPWLDRLGFFEVFAAPWYAAIYLLLFTSLVGCLTPRTWEFVGQLRARPVATPRNLGRLPHHDRRAVAGSVDEVADRIAAGLRGWRIARRTEERPGQQAAGEAADTIAVSISAEKGFLRELGNLVFHFSLLGLLVAIAVGKMVGYEGSVIVNVGSQFCSTSPASYDN
ncbi:MAG TPA: cytochrome c biogenesis protein ResB, partial [Nakamurella sp.]